MAYRFEWDGAPNNNNGFSNYPNSYFYTDNIGGFPAGNVDRWGNRVVRVYGMGEDWSQGATYRAVVNNGQYMDGDDTIVNPSGSFQFRVGHGGGTLRVGRNTAAGRTMVDSGDGYALGGTITGWLDWATVPTAPSGVSVTPNPGGTSANISFGGAASDGGAGTTGWTLQWANNSGFSGAAEIGLGGGNATISGLAPGQTYWFRASQNNTVGSGPWGGVGSALMLSGGKVRVGGGWTPGLVKVRDGGVWKNGVIRVRQGGTWRDAL